MAVYFAWRTAWSVWNSSMRVKLALSTLCENPGRRTGLSTLFPEFIAHARRLYPEVSWIVFVGTNAPWPGSDPSVEVCRKFVSNELPIRRLFADHFLVAPEARKRGASALLTVGFFPVQTAGLAIAMQVFSVNHLNAGGLRNGYRRWAVSRGLKRASVVIANSFWTKSQLGATKVPIVVSPEGLRHDIFKPEGPIGTPAAEGRYLLWVSNLYPYKRIGLVLAAYAGLAPEIRSKFPLVIVGGDWRGELARAKNEAGRLGVLKNVRFLGWVSDEDLPALYRGAVAHLLSTSEETFGRSVLEAMACGCPNIIQDIPILREVAAETAWYVDYNSTPAATALLEKVCAGDGGMRQLTAAGIARSKNFSFDRLARERVDAILSHVRKVLP
jgi:glycosyltransferase involved in cell wall biosynthesis